MKLLIITQKIDKNDSILGFFHRWVEEFAGHTEKLTVICLEKGEYNLPGNVEVYSLGKEQLKIQNSKFKILAKFKYILNFYKYIFKFRKDYGAVFVHMNPIYIVLGGLFWRILNKRVAMWYTHKSVDLKLHIAEKFAHIIFSASRESFQMKSSKLTILGHGIDVDMYSHIIHENNEILEILHVGRITRIKNIGTLVEAGKILKNTLSRPFRIIFVGAPITSDDFLYLDGIRQFIRANFLEDTFAFVGSIQPDKILAFYKRADIAVNMTPTGGVDKAVLESMACGIPTISSNASFYEYFGNYSTILSFKTGDANALANTIYNLVNSDKFGEIGHALRNSVVRKANLPNLISDITSLIYYGKASR